MAKTREKLVELKKVLRECLHFNYDEFSCDMSLDVDLTAENLINQGVTVQAWISVKEHLPQDDLPFGALCEIVQVLLDDGTVTVGWCNRGLKCWYYMPINAANFVGHDYDNTPVIAWQPLAQPPKGE